MLNNDKEYEQLKSIASTMQTANGISWAGLVRREDGSLEEVIRKNRPCFGEMRRYHDGTRPGDSHPGDIPKVIPFGAREAFAASIPSIGGDGNRLVEWMLGPSSPWRRGLGKDVSLLRNSKGRYNAFCMSDTDVDPTVLVNLLVTMRNANESGYTIRMEKSEAAGLTFNQALVARLFAAAPNMYCGGSMGTEYYLSSNLSLRRFMSGESLDLSNGRTWREQEDYNRPELHLIFGGRSDLPDYSETSIRNQLNRQPGPDNTVEDVLGRVRTLCEANDIK